MSSAFLAASCFAIITAPLAVFGTQPLTLELGNIDIYRGKLEDVASPYLGAAALGSLALGVLASRKFARRSTRAIAPPSSASLSPAGKPSSQTNPGVLTSPLFLSQQHLKEQGLDAFLEPNGLEMAQFSPSAQRPVQPFASTANVLPMKSASAVIGDPAPVRPALAERMPRAHERSEVNHSGLDDLVLESWAEAFLSDAPLVALKASVASAVAAPLIASAPERSGGKAAVSQVVPFQQMHGIAPVMPAAQAYLSFSRLAANTAKPYAPARDLNAELAALQQLETVRKQIQMLSAQMELLQANLNPQSLGSTHLIALPKTASKPTYTVAATESSSPSASAQVQSKSISSPAAPLRTAIAS